MDEVTRISTRLIVMSHCAGKLLREVHGVPADKIDLIPHGIPTLPSSETSKQRLGVEGISLLLTFGLLSPDKGIEYVIDALPAVVARHPSVTYVVLGATHPHVKEWHGETYRRSLELRAHKLGLGGHVVFHNRFHRVLSALDEIADVAPSKQRRRQFSLFGMVCVCNQNAEARTVGLGCPCRDLVDRRGQRLHLLLARTTGEPPCDGAGYDVVDELPRRDVRYGDLILPRIE